MAYDLPTNLTYDSGYVEWMQWTGMVTNNYFGILLLLITFLIAWVSISYTDRGQNALMGSTFITFIIGMILWLIGLLSLHWVVLLLLGVAVTAFFGMKKDLT